MSKSLCSLGVRCLGSVGGSLRRDVRPTGMDVTEQRWKHFATLGRFSAFPSLQGKTSRIRGLDDRIAFDFAKSLFDACASFADIPICDRDGVKQ